MRPDKSVSCVPLRQWLSCESVRVNPSLDRKAVTRADVHALACGHGDKSAYSIKNKSLTNLSGSVRDTAYDCRVVSSRAIERIALSLPPTHCARRSRRTVWTLAAGKRGRERNDRQKTKWGFHKILMAERGLVRVFF